MHGKENVYQSALVIRLFVFLVEFIVYVYAPLFHHLKII